MRYLLHQSQTSELPARKDYLYDIFHMYFLPRKSEGSYIPLTPVGTIGLDILFITGHTNQVQEYLTAFFDEIPEKTIVITSCFGEVFKQHASKKSIYVPDLRNHLCQLRDGKPFGFDFDISDAELDLYNTKGEIMERVRSVYDKL